MIAQKEAERGKKASLDQIWNFWCLFSFLTIKTEWNHLTYVHCSTASFLLMDDGGGSCSPLSLIGKPCRGQHLISGVNIHFPILQRDLPVGCEMSISRKHETCLVIKMLSN